MIREEYSKFFQGLEKNNNKEWFHENKQDYERSVKNPFLNLLEQLVPEVEKLEPEISQNPKDALFRINRDIRFSNDKRPYNTIMKAGFAPGGKRSILPAYYLGIDAKKVHVGGGLFNIKGPELKKIRLLIVNQTDEFISIVNSPGFTKLFGELKGERAIRLDKSLQATLEKTPYVANKQFYAMRELPLKDYYQSDQLFSVIVDTFRQISSLNDYLKKALL